MKRDGSSKWSTIGFYEEKTRVKSIKVVFRTSSGALLFDLSHLRKEPSCSFTCPMYSTDTWNLCLKSHPNDMVRQGMSVIRYSTGPY